MQARQITKKLTPSFQVDTNMAFNYSVDGKIFAQEQYHNFIAKKYTRELRSFIVENNLIQKNLIKNERNTIIDFFHTNVENVIKAQKNY